MQKSLHTFHIPVMGTGYTIDSPLKVARYGINSVVSIIDHRLMESMRKHYSLKFDKPFIAIPEDADDSRALRITAYLDFMYDTVKEQFEALRDEPFEPGSESSKYVLMLPDHSPIRRLYYRMLTSSGNERKKLEQTVRESLVMGSIDVNVMTKIDKQNFGKGRQALPVEFNDAHSALRGFAMSKLTSSVVLSAGLNPRLYGYIAQFPDFLPDTDGHLKKRLILKVSDHRSALIQGKFLAKKGLWVSEYRVESGLNCGGHAFATEGHLIGPIMQEFHDKKDELHDELWPIYSDALQSLNVPVPGAAHEILYSVQGGVGNAEEHNLLLYEYGVHSVGWGSPFLLVPEAVNIDNGTVELLKNSKEEAYYLSDISPLGVRFNTVRGTTAELEREKRVREGKPGSPCYKEHLVSNTEYTAEPICTASRQYQKKKIAEIKLEVQDEAERTAMIKQVTDKTCLCVGLGNSALASANAPLYKGMQGVVICPGPNLAYFNREVSLHSMVDHIYGRINLVSQANRPHMFLKELSMYVDFFQERIKETKGMIGRKQARYFESFEANLSECIAYYRNLIAEVPAHFGDKADAMLAGLLNAKNRMGALAFVATV